MELFKLLGTIAIDNSKAKEAMKETQEEAEKSSEKIKDFGDEGTKTESKLSKAFTKIGSAAKVLGKAVVAGVAVGATVLTTLTASAVNNYAEYEQLVGGVETLFKDSGKKVVEYANQAYKTAGLSANAYMQTVTSFSASLLQGLDGDTEKASEIANRAITDMSDNANKMGTDMSMIMNAYQGFAKQNYTMLDNLKLGYGGTQAEMARLINDSGVLGDAITVTAETVNQVSFDKIIEAISVVQDRMGITGTTAKEASTTIQGSISSLKSAWTNFLTGMADPSQDFDLLFSNLIDSGVTVIDNLLPRIAMTLPRLAEGLSQVLDKLIPMLPGLLQDLLPSLIKGGISLVQGLVKALPKILSALSEALPGAFSGIPMLGELFGQLMPMIEELFGQLMPIAEQFFTTLLPPLMQIIQMVLPVLMQLITSLLPVLTPLLDLLQPILDLVLALITPLLQILTAVLPPLISAIEFVVNVLVGLLKPAIELITEHINLIAPVLVFIGELFASTFTDITNIWQKAGNFFLGIVDGIKKPFAGIAGWFKDTFTNAWQKVQDVFSSGGKIFSGIKEGISGVFSKVVNGLITGINNVISVPFNTINSMLNKIRNVGVAGIKPFESLWSANPLAVPQIPQLLAKGGVVNKATPAIIGEDGEEVVMPLERNTQWISKLATQLDDRMQGNSFSSDAIIRKLDELIRAILSLKIYLDSDVLVGGLAPAMNEALGDISLATERGQ